MCHFNHCCHCCSLRTGAKFTTVVSFVYSFDVLVLGFLFLFHATAVEDKTEVRGLVIAGICFLLFGLLLAAGAICLVLGIIWNKKHLVLIWLTIGMIMIIFSILPLFGGPKSGRDLFVTIGLFLISFLWNLFLLYLWIVVLNFYRDLKRGGDGRVTDEEV